jgi:MFS family permease
VRDWRFSCHDSRRFPPSTWRFSLDKSQRNLLAVLLFAVFATVLGVGMAVPLLPVYAHGLGAAGVHIGLLSGTFALSRLLCAPWFARRSDRSGRKRWIVSGLFAYAAVSAALGHIDTVAGLIVARALHGVASAMLMPLIQAYAGDVAPRGREGRVMGIYGAVVLGGLGVGPVLGGLAHDHFGLKSAFAAMGLLSAAGAVLCLLFLPPNGSERHVREAREPSPWRELLADRTVAGLFVFRFCYVVCIGVIWAFLPLHAASTHMLSRTMAGAIVGIGVLGSGLLNLPMGMAADRIDRRRLVLLGGLIAGYGVLTIGGADGVHQLAVSSALFGIGGGIAMPAVMAMATRHGHRRSAMGSVMALMTVAHSAGMMVGALLGGVVMDLDNLPAVFPAGALVMLAGTVVFLVVSLSPEARRSAAPVGVAPLPLR